MKNKLLSLLILCLATSCTMEVSVESDLEELNRTIDEFNKAFETCDISKLDQLTTTDYTHTNSASAAIDKQAWMAYLNKRKDQLASGQLKISKYLFEDRQMSMYEKSAWVTGVVSIDGIMDSTSFSRKIRVSNFWVKDDKQWKRAGFHDTRID